MIQEKDLLAQLQDEAQHFDSADILTKLESARLSQQRQPSLITRLALYNYETLNELMQAHTSSETMIDKELVEKMKKELQTYLDAHLDGKETYKKIIQMVSVYLSFIAHRPLHPPGLFSKDGWYEVFDGKIVCPIREKEMKSTGSLCKYCCSTTLKG